MSDAPEAVAAARMVIRISSASECESTIAVATDLARAFGAEIVGLFVEEEAWFAAGGLPFPAMVTHAGTPIAAAPDRLAEAMRREVEAARRLFARAAERGRLAWSFQAERGEWMALMRAIGGPDDILVLRHDALAGFSDGLIDLALKLAPQRGGVLLLPSHLRFERREIVVVAAGEPSRRLATAAHRLGERLRIGAVEASAAAGSDRDTIRRRIDQAWLAMATLERLADRDSWEAGLLRGRFRTPLLLLRD